MNKKTLSVALFAAVLLSAGSARAMVFAGNYSPVFVSRPVPVVHKVFVPQQQHVFFQQRPVFFAHSPVFTNQFAPPVFFKPAPFFNQPHFFNQPQPHFFNQPMNRFMFNNNFGFGGMQSFPFGMPMF